MQSTADRPLYRWAGITLLRAAAHTEAVLPPWPEVTATTPAAAQGWCAWLRQVWAIDGVAEAVEHASPDLAGRVEAMSAGEVVSVRQARSVVLSMSRYLLRMTGRATPIGLLAGIAPASFGDRTAVRWGNRHRPVARAGAPWLAELIQQLEGCPQLLERLPVLANNLCFGRGDRLIVPCQPQPDGRGRIKVSEVSLDRTAAVQIVLEAARAPVRCVELADKLTGEFPAAGPSLIRGLLAELVKRRVLISSLHAPSTAPDAFGHLLDQLRDIGVDDVPQIQDLLGRLQQIERELAWHNDAASASAGRRLRGALSAHMQAVSPTPRHPVAVDLRLDAEVRLPWQVAREAEMAASVLARLSADPFGVPSWQEYHTRFFERYGIGALVPLLDVIDPDVGLGFPAGYAGSTAKDRRPALSVRDERLLALAQAAVLDGRDEVTLDEEHVDELAHEDLGRAQVPPHLEVCFTVQATSPAAVDRGAFELTVLSVSRGAGTATGRFLPLLDPADRSQAAAAMVDLPASDPETTLAQLSFPPLSPGAAHVTRAPQVLPTVVSLAEHRPAIDSVIGPGDLAVGSDGHRLYLAAPGREQRLEPVIFHALDLRGHTSALARFLAEVGRAQAACVTDFDWGAAAHLPVLPRIRYRQTILSPARWRVGPGDLPGPDVPWAQWRPAMAAWRRRRRLVRFVHLVEGDRRLRLDLEEPHHLALLRAHLDRTRSAVVTEAPESAAHEWIGGRSHEFVVALRAADPPRWPRVPAVTPDRLIRRDHGHRPAASRWLYAKLYGHPARHAEILAAYLPDLWARWGDEPPWWYIPYRDPHDHLRLRIALPSAEEFGPAAHRISDWALDLRRVGLLGDLQFATYHPEIGRWGTGPAMTMAEEVFAADSQSLAVQFAQLSRPHSQILAAANFLDIATSFTGSIQNGMNWLIRHAHTRTPPAPTRQIYSAAMLLADPHDEWSALRASPGGQAIAAMWEKRRRALAAYRTRLKEIGTFEADHVLTCLLHAHHIRANGIDRDDEHVCLRLARAAALSWTARTDEGAS